MTHCQNENHSRDAYASCRRWGGHRRLYVGSYFWLIISLLFFPVTFVLLAKNIRYRKEDGYVYRICYHGSFAWLIVWALIFFPIAILLFLLNGFHQRPDLNFPRADPTDPQCY